MPLHKEREFRGVSRRPWVPNQLLSETHMQHRASVQSGGLPFPTPSLNRLGALLCPSIQGSTSLKIRLNFKRRRSNFTVRGPSRYHLNHISKVNITITNTYQHDIPRYNVLTKTQCSFSSTLPKNASPWFNHQISNKSKSRDILQNKGLFKTVKIMKDQKNRGTVRLEDTKEAWPLNAMLDPRSGP